MISQRLVLLCAGPDSLHITNRWHRQDLRDFQLWIVWYGQPHEAPSEEDCDRLFCAQGSKWELVRHVADHIELAAPNWLWIPDDDLAVDVLFVNHFFEMCETMQPDMAQPSLAPRNVSCHHLLHDPSGPPTRAVDFIEIQMPCFRRDTWRKIRYLLKDNNKNRSGWGLDCIWSLWPALQKLVINSVVAVHSKPVDIHSGFYKALGIDPQKEKQTLLEKYGVTLTTTCSNRDR